MFKYIKLLCLVSALAYQAKAEGPLQEKKFFQNNGGLIDHISPLLIPENKASTLSNITLDDRGQLSKRNGYTILDSTGTLGTTGKNTVVGGGYHDPATGSKFFTVIVGSVPYRTSNTFNSIWTNISSNTVTLTAADSNLAQHTSLNDTQVFCNDSDAPFGVAATGNASPLTNSPSGAKTCATYGNYLIVANTTESSVAYPSRVRWSDINTVNTWPANNYIDVDPNDGDKIVSIVTFKDSIYVFKKRTIYRMAVTGSDGADAFIIRPFTRNLGCWAKNSVRVIPNLGIAFLAQNTVYVLGDNELSSYNYSQLDPVGDPIQRTFDGMSRTLWGQAVAGVYPHKYQYWISMSQSGTSNDTVLVYDYIQKAWSVFSGINANMLEQAEDSTGQNIFLSGDYSGNVYKQDTGTSDNPSNVTTAISGSYTTGDIYLDTPDLTKNFKYIYIFSQVDVNTTVTVEAAYDFTYDYEFTQNVSLGSATTALYNTAVYDTAVYPGAQYKVTRLELNRSARAIKLRFSNSSNNALVGILGWSLIYTSEDFKQ